MGCRLWGHTESDTTEVTQQQQQQDGPSWVAQVVKNLPAMQETLVGKFPWRRVRLPAPVFLGSPGGFDGKESACSAGDLGSVPKLGRSPGEGNDNSVQYSCLENPWTEEPGRLQSPRDLSPMGFQRVEHN